VIRSDARKRIESSGFDCEEGWFTAEPEFDYADLQVDPDTGGRKGQKDCQLGAAPAHVLKALGRVYGHGAKKYDRNNYRQGYATSLSIDALERHLLAHVMWHCACLMDIQKNHPEKDDRWNPTSPASTSTPSPEPDSPSRAVSFTRRWEEWRRENEQRRSQLPD
jgi:hypothetical protein